MGEDASLDEFFVEEAGDGTASGDEHSAETDVDGEHSDGTAVESDPASDSVEPATTTYEFAPDGVVCSACGATVERRWQQDGSLVCRACKDW